MLTVKHVNNGTEKIILAPYGVEYVGPMANWGIGGPHLSIPHAPETPGMGIECQVLHGGIAYVMNDAGATVGTYRLGDAPEKPPSGACSAPAGGLTTA